VGNNPAVFLVEGRLDFKSSFHIDLNMLEAVVLLEGAHSKFGIQIFFPTCSIKRTSFGYVQQGRLHRFRTMLALPVDDLFFKHPFGRLITGGMVNSST